MRLKHGEKAPYTSASAMETTLTWFRAKGPADLVDPVTLVRAGVPESIAARTIQSLMILGLLDKDNKPTTEWRELALIRGDEEYRVAFQEWLREAYADVLSFSNPEVDDFARVSQGFLGYQPSGRRQNMVALFLGMWRYAGLPVSESLSAPAPSSKAPTALNRRKSEDRQLSRAKSTPPASRVDVRTKGVVGIAEVPPALQGLLQQLPVERGWTESKRAAWVDAFTRVLDISVPVVADERATDGDEEG